MLISIELEPITPVNSSKPCKSCVLSYEFMCLDRSCCKFQETGKVWKKKDPLHLTTYNKVEEELI